MVEKQILKNKIKQLEAERDDLLRQRGGDTGYDCVYCTLRVYGMIVGAGNGDGNRFAHPECWYKKETHRLQDKIERLLKGNANHL